jgi:hypothetical protein
MIADASVLLCAFFPDESQAQAQTLLRDHAAGHARLKAPTVVVYEVTNAIWQAERRGRISSAQADQILQAAAGLRSNCFRWTGAKASAGAPVQPQRLRCGVSQPGGPLERTAGYCRRTIV